MRQRKRDEIRDRIAAGVLVRLSIAGRFIRSGSVLAVPSLRRGAPTTIQIKRRIFGVAGRVAWLGGYISVTASAHNEIGKTFSRQVE